MAKVITGTIQSWAGLSTLENHIIATGAAPYAYTLTQTTETPQSTGFAASPVAHAYTAGLRSWAGTFSGRWKKAAALTGYGAYLSTFTGSDSNAYNTAVFAATLNMTAGSQNTTGFGTGSAVTDAEWSPLLWDWTLTAQAWLDDAAVLPNTDAAAAWQASAGGVVLTLASGHTIGGTGIISQYAYGQNVGNLATVNITMKGTGPVTGVGAANIIPAAAIVRPVAGSLVLNVSNNTADQIATGDAFLTSLNVAVAGPGALVDVTGSFQGTGALTHTRV